MWVSCGRPNLNRLCHCGLMIDFGEGLSESENFDDEVSDEDEDYDRGASRD